MEREQLKTPEPTRGTLPNTDQSRIPHSEYGHNWRRRQDADAGAVGVTIRRYRGPIATGIP